MGILERLRRPLEIFTVNFTIENTYIVEGVRNYRDQRVGMTKVSKFSVVLGFLLLSTTIAGAYFEDGNKLYRDCSSEQMGQKWYCMGYIIGVWDALEGSGWTCFEGAGATKGQSVDVVKQFLRDNPSKRNRSAGQLVREALTEAFSCKRAR